MKTRFVHSPLLIVALFLTILPNLFSQEITHDTPATEEQLTTWLHSNDPRLIAWAATLARERKQGPFIALLPDWLKQSPLITDSGYSPNREESRAYDAVLDALIRGGSQPAVEPNVLRELGYKYAAQAFLLLGRLPAEQQLPALKEWFSVDELDARRSGLGKLAAMRLAQWPSPVPGFAARIVAASEEQFTIDLRSTTTGDGGLGGSGVACGDSMYRPPAAGWPVVYIPLVEEGLNQFGTNDTLIALGDERISYRWVEENSPGGSCAYLQGFDQHTRQEIVAHWLDQPQDAMKWQTAKHVTVVWSNRAAYDAALGRLVEHEEENLAAMTTALFQKGLLSKNEASWVRARLVVGVICHIEPCPLQGAPAVNPQEFSPPFLQ